MFRLFHLFHFVVEQNKLQILLNPIAKYVQIPKKNQVKATSP